MADLTEAEMGAILLAHGTAEMEFDVEATMATVVPEPHYEIAHLGWAIDGWDAVHEMYKRLISGNRTRNIEGAPPRVSGVARNTLVHESTVTFDSLKGERVTGLYTVIVAFDPDRKQVIGERMYIDPVFGQLWAENLGEDFANVPGVSRIVGPTTA
jgi:hypothetical protein